MKTYAALAAVAALGIALSGCASVVRGTHQAIQVTTPPTEGASCTLTTAHGKWTVMSPGSVTVDLSKSDIDVVCTKAGFSDGHATVSSGFQEWTIGNIILGGLVGLAIDWSDGAINKYPHSVAVPMTPASGGGGGGSSNVTDPQNGSGS